MAIVRGPRLWAEDDATVDHDDHETVHTAYKRLFKELFMKSNAVEHEDTGDADIYQMFNGAVVVVSYPGNSEIYAPLTERARMGGGHGGQLTGTE